MGKLLNWASLLRPASKARVALQAVHAFADARWQPAEEEQQSTELLDSWYNPAAQEHKSPSRTYSALLKSAASTSKNLRTLFDSRNFSDKQCSQEPRRCTPQGFSEDFR